MAMYEWAATETDLKQVDAAHATELQSAGQAVTAELDYAAQTNDDPDGAPDITTSAISVRQPIWFGERQIVLRGLNWGYKGMLAYRAGCNPNVGPGSEQEQDFVKIHTHNVDEYMAALDAHAVYEADEYSGPLDMSKVYAALGLNALLDEAHRR